MMKKVLLVATVQSHICQFHRPLAEVLREDGWTIHVAARDNLEEKNGLRLDFADEVYNVPFCRSPLKLKNLVAYRQLKRIICSGEYDVVHCNTPVGGILTRIAAKGARKKGTKVYYTAHGFHFYKGASFKNWLIYYPIEKWFAKKTDKLITIVSEDYELAKEKFNCPIYRIHGVGVDEKKFHPISEDEKSELRKRLGFSDNQKIILCVGELLANKNQQMILHAMPDILKNNPDAVLLLAGNGPKKEALGKIIKTLNLQDKVKMLGYVTNIHEYHKISDILVSCSKREGLPLNVIESMLTGNPVVLVENRGHRELIHGGENGYLVAYNHVNEMSKCVLHLLGSKKLVKKFSSQAKNFSSQYTSEKVKEELKEIYQL